MLLLIITFELIQSCGGLVYNEHLFSNYYLTATDDEDDMSLSYHAAKDGSDYGTIVPATVFAIGYNSNYFIIKQHPRITPNNPDKKITNYYILPIKAEFNYRSMNGLIGPITFEQFQIKRHELGIPDSLTFKKEFEDLK